MSKGHAETVWVQLSEVDDLLNRFLEELRKPSGDGKTKRARGEKPPWYQDDSHEAAVFSHITKWKRGETIDPDSNCHTLVNAAWRLLAIACQETGNVPVTDAWYQKFHPDEITVSRLVTEQEAVKLGLPSKAPESPSKTTDSHIRYEPTEPFTKGLEGLREPCKSSAECCNLWPRCFSCPHAPLRGWDQ